MLCRKIINVQRILGILGGKFIDNTDAVEKKLGCWVLG